MNYYLLILLVCASDLNNLFISIFFIFNFDSLFLENELYFTQKCYIYFTQTLLFYDIHRDMREYHFLKIVHFLMRKVKPVLVIKYLVINII